ncbi:MAG: biotin/lipoyl-binding protein, partial [Bacteroidetes bacterium]
MSTFFEKQFDDSVSESKFQSFQQIYRLGRTSTIKYWMYGILALLIIILFLPWTQNIRAKGAVTTLRQEQRPQELNTIIGGRVIKWYVKEGDNVKKGDTILQLGEVKVDYFDPKLLQRTQQQINAKQQSMQGYAGKAQTAGLQVAALTEGQALKLSSLDNKIKQQRLKIESDSIDLQAVKTEVAVAQRQIEAAQQMWDAGVISLIDFERRKVTFQNVTAKRISVENKFLQGKQELINLYIEKNSTIQEYTDKISKAQGDKFSALSDAASTEADVSKLENVYASYDIRNQLYYVTAPQDGQVIQAKKAGIGEIVKEGEMVVEIVPREI